MCHVGLTWRSRTWRGPPELALSLPGRMVDTRWRHVAFQTYTGGRINSIRGSFEAGIIDAAPNWWNARFRTVFSSADSTPLRSVAVVTAAGRTSRSTRSHLTPMRPPIKDASTINSPSSADIDRGTADALFTTPNRLADVPRR